MQLTYNNQSLLATGCYEQDDTGLTRMGRTVVAEMNRVGLVVDMSHSAERSTLRRSSFPAVRLPSPTPTRLSGIRPAATSLTMCCVPLANQAACWISLTRII